MASPEYEFMIGMLLVLELTLGGCFIGVILPSYWPTAPRGAQSDKPAHKPRLWEQQLAKSYKTLPRFTR